MTEQDLATTIYRPTTEVLLKGLRDEGWSVGCHNDYQQNGKQMTFWLMTHQSGAWMRGEAETDAEALQIIRDSVEQTRQP